MFSWHYLVVYIVMCAFYVCMCAYICVPAYVNADVSVAYACVYVWRPEVTTGVFLGCFPLYLLRSGLPWNLELTD